MLHENPHPLAGQTVKIKTQGKLYGHNELEHEFHVEDWWDRVSGGSWMNAGGNLAAIGYGMRSGLSGLPLDNEVVYGKVKGLGYLIHVSEIVSNDELEEPTD